MYQVLAGKKSLVFPVMCNGFVKLDYSDNVVDTNSDGDTSNDIAYGLFDHEGSFTFEAIVTPYDINGYGRQSASGSIPSFTASKKIMPSSSHQSTPANYQSELYLPVNSGRLTHKIELYLVMISFLFLYLMLRHLMRTNLAWLIKHKSFTWYWTTTEIFTNKRSYYCQCDCNVLNGVLYLTRRI